MQVYTDPTLEGRIQLLGPISQDIEEQLLANFHIHLKESQIYYKRTNMEVSLHKEELQLTSNTTGKNYAKCPQEKLLAKVTKTFQIHNLIQKCLLHARKSLPTSIKKLSKSHTCWKQTH
jgi:hypothetical protein